MTLRSSGLALLVFSIIGFDVAAQIDADQVGHAPDTSMFIRSVTGGVGSWDSLYWTDLHGTAPDSIIDLNFAKDDLTLPEDRDHNFNENYMSLNDAAYFQIHRGSLASLRVRGDASGGRISFYGPSTDWSIGAGVFEVNDLSDLLITPHSEQVGKIVFGDHAYNQLFHFHSSTGETRFYSYGSGTFADTDDTYVASFDASGNVQEMDSTALADFVGVNRDTIEVQEDGTTEITKLDSLDFDYGFDVTGSVGHAVIKADTAQLATQYDLTQVGGGSVSFGLDNEIPYTNSTTDDFDYSSNFTFDGADLNVDANTLFVDGSTDRVGIGTTTPNVDLEVFGEFNGGVLQRIWNRSGGTAATAQYTMIAGAPGLSASGFFGAFDQGHSTTEWQDRIIFGSNSTAQGISISAHNSGQDIRFYTNSTGTPKMTLDPQGQLVVGTTTDAQAEIHVQHNTSTNSMELEMTGTNDPNLLFSISGDSYALGIDNSDNDEFKIAYAASEGTAALGTNDRLTLDATGQFAFPAYTPGAFDGTDSYIFSGSATGDVQQMNMQEIADTVEAYITFPDAGSLSGNIDTVFHTSSSGLIDTVIVANPEGGNGTDTLNGIFSAANDGATSPGSFDVDIETQFTFEAGLLDLFPAGDLISMFQAAQDVKLQVFGDQDIKKASGDGTTMIAFSNNDHTSQPPISFPTAAGGIASVDGVYIFIDSNDDGDFSALTISADGQTPATDTPLFHVVESQSTDNEDNGYVRFDGGVRFDNSVSYGGASNQTLDGTNFFWTYTGSTGITVNLPNQNGVEFRIANEGSVSITLDPVSGQINGAATYTLTAGSGVIVYKHPGSDYFAK